MSKSKGRRITVSFTVDVGAYAIDVAELIYYGLSEVDGDLLARDVAFASEPVDNCPAADAFQKAGEKL